MLALIVVVVVAREVVAPTLRLVLTYSVELRIYQVRTRYPVQAVLMIQAVFSGSSSTGVGQHQSYFLPSSSYCLLGSLVVAVTQWRRRSAANVTPPTPPPMLQYCSTPVLVLFNDARLYRYLVQHDIPGAYHSPSCFFRIQITNQIPAAVECWS